MKIIVTRDMTLCNLVDVYRHFSVQVHQNIWCCIPEGSNLHRATVKTSCLTKYGRGCMLWIWASIWVKAWRLKGNQWLVKYTICVHFQCSTRTLHTSCLVYIEAFKIWCYMNSVSEDSCVLGCDAMLMDEWFLMFQRNIVSSSLEQSHKALCFFRMSGITFPMLSVTMTHKLCAPGCVYNDIADAHF